MKMKIQNAYRILRKGTVIYHSIELKNILWILGIFSALNENDEIQY